MDGVTTSLRHSLWTIPERRALVDWSRAQLSSASKLAPLVSLGLQVHAGLSWRFLELRSGIMFSDLQLQSRYSSELPGWVIPSVSLQAGGPKLFLGGAELGLLWTLRWGKRRRGGGRFSFGDWRRRSSAKAQERGRVLFAWRLEKALERAWSALFSLALVRRCVCKKMEMASCSPGSKKTRALL